MECRGALGLGRLILFSLLFLTMPSQLQAQTTEPATTESATIQPPLLQDLDVDLVPMNNTVVRQIPANFYCRITDRTEVVSDIQTQWYINNIIHTEVIGLFEIIVNGGQAQTNLSIFSAFDTSIFVSCRSSFYPNTNLGVFQVEIPLVTISFDQTSVNASEGNYAVVCVSAFFMSELAAEQTFFVDVSLGTQGSADVNDFSGSIPSTIGFTINSGQSCLRIFIANDTVVEGNETFTLELSISSQNRNPGSVAILPGSGTTVVNIRETCYDGEIRLRGGYDVNQGRVEICYSGVWGTVCDDGAGWAEGGLTNARVVCRQLGLQSSGPMAYERALFGPGSLAMPILLDDVICSGSETNLLSCTHGPVGEHNCGHSQDVSVDCLGRSPVGAPCSTTDEIRLVGGVDQFQGRVEVCTSFGVYSTVCSNGWDNIDAQVVCRQLGFEEGAAPIAAQDALFGMGVGTIQISNVNCIGNESTLTGCSAADGTACIHFQDAGVECLGRALPGPPAIGFVRGQDNTLNVREGDTLELCIVLESGRIPSEFMFNVLIFRAFETVNLTQDFIIESTLEMGDSSSNDISLFLGPTVTRSCLIIDVIDDQIPEDAIKTYQFQIETNVEIQEYQVSNLVPAIVNIIDDDFECGPDERQCIDIQNPRCIASRSVCNALQDCFDGSDETNCPDHCLEAGIEDGFNCMSEMKCIPQVYECDGVPDCVTQLIALDETECNVSCSTGDILSPLTGGASEAEGQIQVCVDGIYYPVALDNGRFSVREATVICSQLDLGNAGIPTSDTSIFSLSFNMAFVSCRGTETSVSDCDVRIQPFDETNQASVKCFQQTEPPCNNGAIRLADGPNPSEGRVEICYQNVWGVIYDENWTTNDTAVVCSQLGFDRYGGIPVTGVAYGVTDTTPVSITSPSCVGGEASILDCPVSTGESSSSSNFIPSLGESGRYQNERVVMGNIVGARCEVYPSGPCTFLDTRLTFRSAESTGLLEVCNEMGEWSIVCADSGISSTDVNVVCNQLGFGPTLVPPAQYSVEIDASLYGDSGRPISTLFNGSGFGCIGAESNLTQCAAFLPTQEPTSPSLPIRRRKRIVETCTLQAGIGCNAMPRVIFTPPSVDGTYEVEVGRNFGLTCSYDVNISPEPIIFSTSRLSQRLRRGLSNNLQLISFQPITTMEDDFYTCSGSYSIERQFGESVRVIVRGPTGLNESAYIRLSTLSFDRFNVAEFSPNREEFANDLASLVFDIIPAEVPGVHVVDYCRYVNSTEFDVQRGMERLECKVTQYSDENEQVMPVDQVLVPIAVQLIRTLSIFQARVDVSDTGFCDSETIVSTTGTTFVWPETAGNSFATFECPLSEGFFSVRFCEDGGVWQSFDEGDCGVVLGELTQLNDSFNNLTVETYSAAVASLTQLVSQTANSTVEQNSGVLDTVSNYFGELAIFVNTSNVTINVTVIDDVVQAVSALLQWQPANVRVDSSSNVVESFEVVVSIYAQQLPLNENQTFVMPDITLVAELRSVDSLTQTGRSFAIGENEVILAPGGEVMPGQLLPQQDAAINLPASLFGLINDRPNVGVFFALYDVSTLFPVNQDAPVNRDTRTPVQTEVGSRVIAATVGPGINFQNLNEPVTIVLRRFVFEGQFVREGSEVCVSWDFTLQDWSTEGCFLSSTTEDGIVTCNCNHLTNFAVLVDVCLRQEDCAPSRVDEALTFISYIGMSISIVSLVLTILTLLSFKKLRQKDASKYHVQLSLAILLMLIVAFVLIAISAENVTPLYGGCVTISVLVHYFTLVAVMWMGAEALLMFQKLVIVFSRVTTKYIVSVSIICWTVPIVPVLIPLIVDLATGHDIANDIIVRRANSSGDISFCFLSHPGAFWGAFLAPIFAILLFNIVIFIWVIVILIRHTRGMAHRKQEKVSTKTIIRLMISITGVMFLFGLSWLFSILTISITGLRDVFQVLFVIFNSFQGFYIFLFFCVFNKEAVESWKEFFTCGKYRSKLLHPSHAKFSSSAGQGKAKQTKTGSTGFGTSSGGKHYTEVSKSDYDSTTLTKQKEFDSEIDVETTPVKVKQDLAETSNPEVVLVVEDLCAQNQNGNVGLAEEDGGDNKGETENKPEDKKKKKTLSLKARIKRYSTKKISKHHVEEVEVDFKSDESDDSDSAEEVTDAV